MYEVRYQGVGLLYFNLDTRSRNTCATSVSRDLQTHVAICGWYLASSHDLDSGTVTITV